MVEEIRVSFGLHSFFYNVRRWKSGEVNPQLAGDGTENRVTEGCLVAVEGFSHPAGAGKNRACNP